MSNKKGGMPMQPEKKNDFEPKLRFPEFRGTAEWKLVQLNKLAKRCTQKNRNGTIARVLTNSAEYGVVDQRDYFDKDIATQGKLENYYVVEKDDYVYNPRISAAAPVGPISKNKVAVGVMSPLYSVFRFDDNNNDFYAYYFKTTGWHQYMRQASSTGARHDRMAITNNDFMAMPLPVSTSEEQQKIADCLSSLDVLIGLEVQKIGALKCHKKGLMQQLFPVRGETQPRLRFPEFYEQGEWEEKPFSAIVDLISGMHLSPDKYSEIGEVPYFSGPSDFMNESSNARKWTALTANAARDGDTLITVKGSGVGEVWFSSLPAVALGRQLMAVRAKEGQIRRFVFQFLLTKKRRFEVLGAGNLIPGISRPDILDLMAFFPEPPEQQRIADCLTYLDDLIAAETRKLDTLKTHKKGLMQQLFPQVGEAVA
ncbi:TPA: restriction endonuclease subunit S [Serratia marcescens]|uniref:restriction endonuclease subunit S n=1 Tax=Serratia marcescens TaxID=615 RepID=UPI0018D92AC3|nr:restriction endonuclease subunit S [Serratia marcescens]MBH2590420.1 restriction endonuclease subunit S [Serratia marcescens]MBN5288084.1 restriction endonuclease subunit S [Serratia marcescens]HEJ6995944.1 restriction endonuclease subunit S [Serratia marcescens]